MTAITQDEILQVRGHQKPVKLHSIQFLRALAAMLVVIYHAQQSFSERITPVSFTNESYFFAFGAVGVHIFFVISGFIMIFTSKFEPCFDAKAFFRRRILRIYPIYWICAAMYLGGHAIMGIPYDLGIREFLGAVLLVPDYSSKIIGPGWTLAYEVFFYICFGFFMIAGLNLGLVLLTLTFFITVALGVVLPFDNLLWNFATNSLLLEFLAGSAIGWLFVRDYLPQRGGVTVIIIAVALFAAGIAIGYDRFPSALMWGLPSVLLIAGSVMFESKRVLPKWIEKMGYFGDSSYALYLIHILLITVVLQLFIKLAPSVDFPPAILALMLGAVALIVAEFIHHQIEKPLLRRLYTQRQKAAVVPT